MSNTPHISIGMKSAWGKGADDDSIEKIKQYSHTVDELTLKEQQAILGQLNRNPKEPGGFDSLLLPHEWLKTDAAYDGPPPALPPGEYRALSEVKQFKLSFAR